MINGENKKQDSIITLIRQNLFQIVALLVAVFNIWLASRLAPLATSIALVDQRVMAIESIRPIGSESYGNIIHRLESIENKVDRVIEREIPQR